mgnify:CR=1 FL=1
MRSPASSSTPARFAPQDFFPTKAHRDALLRIPQAAARPLRAALRDARQRTARADAPRIQGDQLPRRARLLPQVHRRRAHAADHPQSGTADSKPGRSASASQRLLDELDAPELLVLALLYHDVGKWRDDNHHVESARMARADVRTPASSTSTRARWWSSSVVEHLKMSVAAFRRDTEDPEVVRQFAELVGVEERLKMLCLMTLADVEAVSPETLTPWREELLWRLSRRYLQPSDARHMATRSSTRPASGVRLIADLIEQRPADLLASEIEVFLQGLPRRYLQLFSRDAVYSHVRRSRGSVPAGRD